MQQNTLRGLYLDELRDLYNAENQLVKALSKMAKAATSPGLKAGFEKHLSQTQEHVSRLETVFDGLGESPKGKTCRRMEGLTKGGKEMIEEDPADEELNAGLIAAAHTTRSWVTVAFAPTPTSLVRRKALC